MLARYPDDDVTIAVLVNTEGGEADALTVAGNVAGVVAQLGEPVLADLPVTPAEATAYGGTYQRGPNRFRIYSEAGQLRRVVEGSERPPGKLLHQGEGSFAFTVDYPMDRLVFHVVDGRSVGSSSITTASSPIFESGGLAGQRAPSRSGGGAGSAGRLR